MAVQIAECSGALVTRTVERHKDGKTGLSSKMADRLWRVSFQLGLSPPHGPEAWRCSQAISLKEKAEMEARLLGL